MNYPGWLHMLAWAYLSLCFLCAAIIIVHEAVADGQKMFIMYLVWPITALYLGPAALWMYFHKEARTDVAVAAMHCGAGCTLGDIVAEFAVSAGGWTFAGSEFATRLMMDFVLGWTFGIVFQYFSIMPMRHVSPGEGLLLAIRSDTITIIAFQIGLFSWMALVHFVLFPGLRTDEAVFWFMMQIGMIIGYFTSLPANVFVLNAGWKERMS